MIDEIDLIVRGCLVNERHDHDPPTVAPLIRPTVASTRAVRPVVPGLVGRKDAVRIVVIMEGQPQLLGIVLALRPAGGFTSLLHGGEQ